MEWFSTKSSYWLFSEASETHSVKPSNVETPTVSDTLKAEISETGLSAKAEEPCLSDSTVKEVSSNIEDDALNLITIKKTESENAEVPVKSEEIEKSELDLKTVTPTKTDKESPAVHKEDDDETLSESEAGNVKDFDAPKLLDDSKHTTPLKWKNDVEGVALSRDDEDVLNRSAVTSPCPEVIVAGIELLTVIPFVDFTHFRINKLYASWLAC